MRLRLTIDGMLAVHAKNALYTALGGVAGVRSAEVEVGGVRRRVCVPGITS